MELKTEKTTSRAFAVVPAVKTLRRVLLVRRVAACVDGSLVLFLSCFDRFTIMASPISPKLLKGGIVLLDAATSAVRRVISLQYNPEEITRSFQISAAGGDGADRSEALRLKGPPVEMIKLKAEMDAVDQLEFPSQNMQAVAVGLQAQLAVLELMVYPDSAQLAANDRQANLGFLEIIPMEAPLVLFVWNRSRIVPVRITELSITEKLFDPSLNPILAEVSLGLRVLSVDDLGFSHKGGSLYMAYQMQKEALAASAASAPLADLGLQGAP